MKIGIDLSMLVYAGSGVATYTYNFARSLLQYDKENSYCFFYSSFRRPKNFYYLEELKKQGATITELPLPASVIRFLWNRNHILPVEWFIGKVDFFHSSDYLRPPLLKGTKGITTIHDLTWKLFPQYHTKEVISHHERKLKRTIALGDIIIVDSENTRRDLINAYSDIKKKNIHLLHLGVDERFKRVKNPSVITRTLSKYLNQSNRGSAPYLLYVGAIEPRKNLDTAIRVYADLIKEKRYSSYRFLVAGRAGWKNEHIFSLVKELGLQKKVLFIGFVLDEDLPALYSGASALIYLSLYEGFGLPPLEAAFCGTPSLIYRNSSLAETFPEEYSFAKSTQELPVLRKILDSQMKIDRRHFEQFTWKKYVNRFLDVISLRQS